MNRHLVERLIPHALEILEEGRIAIVNSGRKIPREYHGYFASFGASVVTSGLRQSVLFFSSAGAQTSEDRCKVTEMIMTVLQAAGEVEQHIRSLTDFVSTPDTQQMLARGLVLDAATACKLALRTFEKEDSN